MMAFKTVCVLYFLLTNPFDIPSGWMLAIQLGFLFDFIMYMIGVIASND